MTHVLITGGTGLIGRALCKLLLANGYQVNILTRQMPTQKLKQVNYFLWDVAEKRIDENAIKQAHYIIHLAGEGIADKPWTAKRKQAIVDSRVASTQLLYSYVAKYNPSLKGFISASGIGYYGGQPAVAAQAELIEDSPAGTDFLANTCIAWENAANLFTQLGIRVVKLRTGIVLANNGGAFPPLKKPVQFFLASPIGNGLQHFSWIHLADLCQLYLFALENNQMQGPYHAVAPEYITQAAFTKLLAKAMNKPFWPIPVPAFLLKLLLGQRSSLVLHGAKISAQKIQQTGFTFQFLEASQAIQHLLQNK